MEHKMSYSPKAIANYFLLRGKREDVPIDPMKIQKLVYFAHGWQLAISGKPLIDERVDAWPFGPVIPTLYHEFKQYGSRTIQGPATEWDGISSVPTVVRTEDPQTLALLDKIWEIYGGLSGIQLSNMTHEKDTPWYLVSQESNGRIVRGTDIPDEMIERHFIELADQTQKSSSQLPASEKSLDG